MNAIPQLRTPTGRSPPIMGDGELAVNESHPDGQDLGGDRMARGGRTASARANKELGRPGRWSEFFFFFLFASSPLRPAGGRSIGPGAGAGPGPGPPYPSCPVLPCPISTLRGSIGWPTDRPTVGCHRFVGGPFRWARAG
ncbi:unnamed protein product [Soboliphyme baturini]|uniref:Uncharacterized protein n=1 Tax=Soboliphyme baturini TaxID=241478 RepID=A0A183IEJ5_9BILA|nr:unnamed protein product [Soboliphyme baturini]